MTGVNRCTPQDATTPPPDLHQHKQKQRAFNGDSKAAAAGVTPGGQRDNRAKEKTPIGTRLIGLAMAAPAALHIPLPGRPELGIAFPAES